MTELPAAVVPLVTTLPARVLDELERVVAMRERWRLIADQAPQGSQIAHSFGPAIILMTVAIDRAKAAIADMDAPGQIRALRDLEGFSHG